MPNNNDKAEWEKWRKIDTEKFTGKALVAWEKLVAANATCTAARDVMIKMCQKSCDDDIATDPTVPEGYTAFVMNKYGGMTYVAQAPGGKKTAGKGKGHKGLII